MKISQKKVANLIRILRLVTGIAGTLQGLLMKEFALSIAGFFLVYMAVAGTIYQSMNNLEMELKEAKSNLKDLEHEKVVARL